MADAGASGFNFGGSGGTPAAPAGPAPLSGPEVGQTVQCCPKEPKEADEQPIRIRISLFFDGTGNNRTNVELGTKYSGDDSYKASATNVALLERAGVTGPGAGNDVHLTHYTEGIGTVDKGEDNKYGYLSGAGDTGIVAKVEIGLGNAVELVKEAAGKRPIVHLHIDTFGFSRGAAAARYCVWACLKQPGKTMKERLQAAGAVVGEVAVKFVGLFDTVSALKDFSWRSDTATLHLDAIAAAEKVVHLAAAEEHRAQFSLTNINSAGGKGRQFFLPGVHSDVGGGYNETEAETGWWVYQSSDSFDPSGAMQKDMAWLVAAGWYRPEELHEHALAGTVTATRSGISNQYSRIPLRLMAEFAREGGVIVKTSIERDFPVPADDRTLQAANEAISAAVKGGRCTTPAAWFGADPAADPAWHKALRNAHLHFSARHNSVGHAPAWSGGGDGFGHRQRAIFNG